MFDRQQRLQLALWCLAFASVVGCTPVERPAAEPASPQRATDQTGFPQELTDARGVKSVLKQRPERIVSLSPQNTELLFAVGGGEQVVGVTSYCDYPPETASRTIVGGFASNSINLEIIVGLRPDLIVAGKAIHAPVVKRLEELGIPALCLEADQLKVLFHDLRLLGQATGHVEQADRVVADLQRRVDQVAEFAERIPESERRTIFYEVWDDPLGAAGPDSFIGQMLAICGGKNIIADPQARYPLVSHEFILAQNPDVILIPDAHANEFQLEEILDRPGWRQLRAVQQRQIHRVDGDLVSRFTPRFFDALPQIARLIYPEHFQAQDEK